jgi:hypothetical protein
LWWWKEGEKETKKKKKKSWFSLFVAFHNHEKFPFSPSKRKALGIGAVRFVKSKAETTGCTKMWLSEELTRYFPSLDHKRSAEDKIGVIKKRQHKTKEEEKEKKKREKKREKEKKKRRKREEKEKKKKEKKRKREKENAYKVSIDQRRLCTARICWKAQTLFPQVPFPVC